MNAPTVTAAAVRALGRAWAARGAVNCEASWATHRARMSGTDAELKRCQATGSDEYTRFYDARCDLDAARHLIRDTRGAQAQLMALTTCGRPAVREAAFLAMGVAA